MMLLTCAYGASLKKIDMTKAWLMMAVMMMIELNACLTERGCMRNPSCLDRTCLVHGSQHCELEASPKVYQICTETET
jgi:hypothetical protein